MRVGRGVERETRNLLDGFIREQVGKKLVQMCDRWFVIGRAHNLVKVPIVDLVAILHEGIEYKTVIEVCKLCK
jgi:hypothetical protein